MAGDIIEDQGAVLDGGLLPRGSGCPRRRHLSVGPPGRGAAARMLLRRFTWVGI